MMNRAFTKTLLIAFLAAMLSYPALAGSGTFIGVEGESVSGKATVSGGLVKLSSDFRTSKGPDLYIYLGNNRPSKIIAKLRKQSGSQAYALPKGINLSDYSKVFIHCKRFNHTFGEARIK